MQNYVVQQEKAKLDFSVN